MHKLVCERCGGAINPKTLTCEYCGTRYKEDRDELGHVHCIQTCPAKLSVLATKIEISNDDIVCMPQETLAEYTLNTMTKELAKSLVPYMKLETERDPYTMKQIVRGSVRVVEPDFRF